SPREILEVMREGVIVVGGGSIGALRAAELCELGMIGVGDIFRMFKSGELDSDDEVAVIINPETLEAISEPLVNIRATISAMVKKGMLAAELGNELIRLAKNLHYSRRSYENLVAESVKINLLNPSEAEGLLGKIRENAINLKKLDAIKVVEKVREICSAEKL
ncbi:MAG: TfuA-like protein, partial [Archaeoglobi archaeon]|nr:TfuA-like protein [Archaeoglobi archaeon]